MNRKEALEKVRLQAKLIELSRKQESRAMADLYWEQAEAIQQELRAKYYLLPQRPLAANLAPEELSAVFRDG